MPNKRGRSSAKGNSESSLETIEGFAKIDIGRHERTAFPEIIFCENKPLERIISIAKAIYSKEKMALGTRCPVNFFPKLKKSFPGALFVEDAKSFRIGKPLHGTVSGCVGILSAGTTDIGTCEESALILESLSVEVRRIYDVGVAGIHRLFVNDEKVRGCDVLIVAAGMEGALPSVIAGLYPQPIIAMPTSTGYGTSMSGFTALFAMLTSCAPGLTVVNIDNGVGAAAAAYKILSFVSHRSGGHNETSSSKKLNRR
jgi:NCAIR mutase (PurE)-related protein